MHARSCRHPASNRDSGPWDSGAGFYFDLAKKKIQKNRQSVSGLACNLDAKQQRICLMVFDEGAEARYAYVGNKVLTIDAQPVVLRVTTDELDAEGAATDGRYFYVTGSHSAKRRGDCASNPGSRHVLRFRLDPATGRALQSPAGSGPSCRRNPSWHPMWASTNVWALSHRPMHPHLQGNKA